MSIKIITDSTSYIPLKLREKYDISVVSLNVIINDKSYREVELKNEEFYIEMDKLNDIPTSSQPSMEESLNIFTKIAKEGHDIVGVFLSSDMSGTYSTMHIVKEMVQKDYPNTNIEIVDSKTNCMQMGYIALQGAKAVKEGKSMEEVLQVINNTINKSKFLFVPDTLKYLKKGGRIGGASALFGTILQIRPILTVEDGKTTVFEKVRTKKKAVNTIMDKVVSDINTNGSGEVIVHHINCEKEGKEIAERLSKELNIDVTVQSIGPVIGLHVGPGSVGVAYYTR